MDVSSPATSADESTVAVPRLYLNHISGLDWLIALEFGRVDDAQPQENWRGVSESFGFLHQELEVPRSASRFSSSRGSILMTTM